MVRTNSHINYSGINLFAFQLLFGLLLSFLQCFFHFCIPVGRCQCVVHSLLDFKYFVWIGFTVCVHYTQCVCACFTCRFSYANFLLHGKIRVHPKFKQIIIIYQHQKLPIYASGLSWFLLICTCYRFSSIQWVVAFPCNGPPRSYVLRIAISVSIHFLSNVHIQRLPWNICINATHFNIWPEGNPISIPRSLPVFFFIHTFLVHLISKRLKTVHACNLFFPRFSKRFLICFCHRDSLFWALSASTRCNFEQRRASWMD